MSWCHSLKPAIQEILVSTVRSQFSYCSSAKGLVVEQSDSATTHSPVFSLVLVPHRKAKKKPKAGGRIECSACRSPLLFYDRLRHVAVSKFGGPY